jgi:hypothetical protein
VDPLVVVWAGAWLGAGGLRGGFTVGLLDVRLGFGLELGRDRAGAELGLGVALAVLLAGLDLTGLVLAVLVFAVLVLTGAVVAAEELGAWLNKFMNPTTPTPLSSVARQVRVDSLRRPRSRCARLSRSLMHAM